MSKTLLYIIFAALVWLIISAIWPFWNKYQIETDLETVALYGTKNSLEDTRRFLNKKIKEEGYAFNVNDFQIEKDENKTVFISISYDDKISYFGVKLKQLEFTIEVKTYNVKEAF